MKTTLPSPASLRALREHEIQILCAQGCRAESWRRVRVADPFDVSRVRDVVFYGEVILGPQTGEVELEPGVRLPAGLYGAVLIDCRVGANVLVRHVREHLARCDIGEGAVLQDVGCVGAGPEATFGIGVEVRTLNEAGGREVLLFEGLSSQFAHALAFFRHRAELIAALQGMIRREAEAARGGRAQIGDRAVVRRCGELKDVRVGPSARVEGALRLRNGTVLSEPAAPTYVGAGVVAEDFVIAEGAHVDSGAVLGRAFVGQATRMGHGFSCQDSLFFCNSEAEHGEAVAVFAGPYTVTHHKGTLLIAVHVSFFNAGSTTNMSNHKYKVGPVHQGLFERGCKTGSGAYLLWPSRVGAFTVVLGKHVGGFDATDFPFSYIFEEPDGRSYLVPGMNLFTAGTWRDGLKWPRRDGRTATERRDLVSCEVFSPLALAAVERAEARLEELAAGAEASADSVAVGGLRIKGDLLRRGARQYRLALESALLRAVAERVAALRAAYPEENWERLRARLAPRGAEGPWMDFGGLLAPRRAVEDLCEEVEAGRIAEPRGFTAACRRLAEAYPDHAWSFVARACARRWGNPPEAWTVAEFSERLGELEERTEDVVGQILADARKEYAAPARIGYGHGWHDEEVCARDFLAVRGSCERDPWVQAAQREQERIQAQAAALRAWLR